MKAFKRRLVVLLSAALLSMSAMAATFSETLIYANQGMAAAQYNLGLMYKKGESVRQSYITAKEWFGKACDNSDQDGCDSYKHLNTKGF